MVLVLRISVLRPVSKEVGPYFIFLPHLREGQVHLVHHVLRVDPLVGVIVVQGLV